MAVVWPSVQTSPQILAASPCGQGCCGQHVCGLLATQSERVAKGTWGGWGQEFPPPTRPKTDVTSFWWVLNTGPAY